MHAQSAVRSVTTRARADRLGREHPLSSAESQRAPGAGDERMARPQRCENGTGRKVIQCRGNIPGKGIGVAEIQGTGEWIDTRIRGRYEGEGEEL